MIWKYDPGISDAMQCLAARRSSITIPVLQSLRVLGVAAIVDGRVHIRNQLEPAIRDRAANVGLEATIFLETIH